MKIILGDSLIKLRDLPTSTVDAVATDGPYEMGFMNRSWDKTGIVNDPLFWGEVLRVLKPGAHLINFGGTRTFHRMASAVEDAGFEIRDMLAWMYGQGFPKSLNLKGEWKGYGTALKPSHEPITLARKPLEKGLTVAQNVLKWGVGGINVDATRIGTEQVESGRAGRGECESGAFGKKPVDTPKAFATGRWPANVLLDEEAAAMLDEQSGHLQSSKRKPQANSGHQNKYVGGEIERKVQRVDYDGAGGASRFFYVAKTSKRERGEGNNHPTVKPIRLMEYLCKLICPPGGVILDPFLGSGSTGCAAVKLGYQFIGIEREAEYVEIARKRIEYWQKQSDSAQAELELEA